MTNDARYLAPPPPQELAARLGLRLDQITKLDANESPVGPPPSVWDALSKVGSGSDDMRYSVGRYPDPQATALRERLAYVTGVPAEGIVVGNGSDEIIQLLVDALVQPDDEVIVSEPTFSIYAFAAHRRGARVVDVARDEEWRIPTDALVEAMTERTRLVFLCSPNNPTGTPLDRATLDAALARAEALADGRRGAGPVVVMDEAYYEVGALGNDSVAWTAAPLVAASGGRLVVLRTFSKVYGLAGLRVGYGLCDETVAELLRTLKPPYNVNVVGQVAALAALDGLSWVRNCTRDVVLERERLREWLAEREGLRVLPSAANFLLVDVAANIAEPEERERRRDLLWQALLDQGVMTRRLSGPRLAGMIRITVGTNGQNLKLRSALMRTMEGMGR